MFHFQICLLFLLPIYVQPYYKRTRTSTPENTKFTGPFTLPDYVDQDFFNQVKFPNESFCQKMALRDAGIYMVMPWWHHYCNGLTEQRTKQKKETERFRMLKPYQAVLEKVQGYKRKQKIWQKMANLLGPMKPL